MNATIEDQIPLVEFTMPALQVPNGYCIRSGIFSSAKKPRSVFPYYSLQSDLITLMKFDPRVVDFEEKPVQIPYIGGDRRMRFYSPDFLIAYHNLDNSTPITTCLIDVSCRAALRAYWSEHRRMYKTTVAFAASRGWKFKILSENEIRTDFLGPARYISQVCHCKSSEENTWLEAFALEVVTTKARTLSKVPIDCIFHDNYVQAQLKRHGLMRFHLFDQLFRLVHSGKIGINLDAFNHRDVIHFEFSVPQPPIRPMLAPLKLPGLWRV